MSNTKEGKQRMEEYNTDRKISVAVGVTLILASATGVTSICNAIVPFLRTGMNVNLAMFMLGPTIATVLSFIMSVVGIKVIDIIGPKWCMLVGSICSGVAIYMIGTATSITMWIVANILTGVIWLLPRSPLLAAFWLRSGARTPRRRSA